MYYEPDQEVIDAIIKCGEADTQEEAEQFCEKYDVDIVTSDYYYDLYDDMAHTLVHDMRTPELEDTLYSWLSNFEVQRVMVKRFMEIDDLIEIPGMNDTYLRILG